MAAGCSFLFPGWHGCNRVIHSHQPYPPHLSGPVLRYTARLSQRYPPIARYGVFGVSTWPIGCNTPSPFPERFPLGEMRSEGAIPPLKRGISAILARYPMKTRQMGAIPPSAILSRKGIARYGGGGLSRTDKLKYSQRIIYVVISAGGVVEPAACVFSCLHSLCALQSREASFDGAKQSENGGSSSSTAEVSISLRMKQKPSRQR